MKQRIMKNLAMKPLTKNYLAKQVLLLLATLSVAPFAQAAFHWSNLWQTPDQRGDTLLRQGNAAEAAQTYTDTRHKAYAELKAGKYANAAHDFAPFKDNDARYNRGNALAHTGDLQGALKAYDAVLANDPKNSDARHNRDLVAKELKKQQQQQKNQPQKKSSSNQDQKNQGKSMQNSPANGQGQNQQKTNPDKQSDSAEQKQNGSTQPNSATPANQKGQNQSPNGSPNSTDQNSKPTSENSSSANPSAKTQTPQERAAQHDAEAGLKSAQEKGKDNQGQAQQSPAPPKTTPAKSARDTTQDEQKMAEKQWLKNIPDNPEGLLQRKFLIEHLMRQQAQKTQP
jgi:Ca-activated chloride channel family protein